MVFVLLFCSAAQGQFRLPQVDVELKGGAAIYDAGNNESVKHMYAIPALGGFHIQINQHIALGAYYSKSLSGEIAYKNSDGQTTSKNTLNVLMTGIDLRLSAGRSVKWRPYLALNYSKIEFVENFTGYNLAHRTNAMGANIGVMLRLSNSLYWNVVEVGARILSDKIYWLNTDFTAEAKTGFTYNIRIKSK